MPRIDRSPNIGKLRVFFHDPSVHVSICRQHWQHLSYFEFWWFFLALFVKKKLVRDWLVWTWLVRFPKGLVMDPISIECSLDFLIFWTESDCWFMFGYCCYVIINYCYYYSLWLLDCYYLLLYIVIIIRINPWNGTQDMLSTTHAPFSKPHFSKPGISGGVKQAYVLHQYAS